MPGYHKSKEHSRMYQALAFWTDAHLVGVQCHPKQNDRHHCGHTQEPLRYEVGYVGLDQCQGHLNDRADVDPDENPLAYLARNVSEDRGSDACLQ